jgi:hypothetical protein
MTLVSLIKLTDEEKLEILQRVDRFRQWHSLDEKRYCLVCGEMISGREIQVIGGTRGNGPLRIICPTERCNSIPMDCVLPTDEILAKVDKMIAEERKASVTSLVNHRDRGASPDSSGYNGIASHLRKFTFHFKRGS